MKGKVVAKDVGINSEFTVSKIANFKIKINVLLKLNFFLSYFGLMVVLHEMSGVIQIAQSSWGPLIFTLNFMAVSSVIVQIQ